MKHIVLLLISVLSVSCNSQEKKSKTSEIKIQIKQKNVSQIGQYVTSVFEDSKGNLWFATIEKGITKYDGHTLKHFTQDDGLPSNRVTGIIQDSKDIFWLKTGEGLSKFDGNVFCKLQDKWWYSQQYD